MWAALQRLTVYGAVMKVVDEEERQKAVPKTANDLKTEVAQMILTKLINEGVFEYKVERDNLKMETRVYAKLIVLK